MTGHRTVPLDLKLAAVLDAEDGHPVSEIAKRHHVSRQSVYRWRRNYREQGPSGLRERPHRPRRRPQRMSPDVEALVYCIKQSRPDWGADRVVRELARLGLPHVPSTSSVRRALRRNPP
ncbi:helix-turn-helix domain-containing protein [Amycolatopsis sacchari]|uniref:helix-turn-helix domain-containing protein n=1 Tax=Amycolatopsis sacchari TaxID=115433 RepID=UPI003D763EA8